MQTERQCWADAQYSRKDTIEVVGIPSSVRDQDLEDKVRNIFGEIGININKREIQACHRLREKGRMIIKFVNRKDCTNILRVKKDLNTLIHLNWPFLRELKCLFPKVYAPITEAFGINVISLE